MSIYDEIRDERARQDAKWGEQNHPSVHHIADPNQRCLHYGILAEQEAKSLCDGEHYAGNGTFASIAVEELSEVVSADDDVARRVELVQLAVVCVQWIEAIDRRAKKGGA